MRCQGSRGRQNTESTGIVKNEFDFYFFHFLYDLSFHPAECRYHCADFSPRFQMQQSFVLIILHISICIHSQLHLWILAGAEADKDSGCIPASGASIPHFVRHCHLYVLFRTGAEHLDRIRCSRPHIRRDCRFFLQPALHPAVLEADFRKKQKCFSSPCCIPSAFTETSGTRSSTYCKPRILKYPAKCGSCLYPCLPPILRNAGCTIPADLWCSYRMALPCILFPSAVTNAVSSMLLPTVAGLQEMKGRQQLRSLILKITCSLHFAWMFLLWCSSDTREMDWNFSVQKSACRKFYSDTRMDLSVSVYEHCTSQHDQWTGKDHLFFSVQPFQPLHTDHRCLSSHPRRRNQRISERSADQPDIPVSLLHSPVICIRRQILTDFPHKKPIHDIKHIFPCIGSFYSTFLYIYSVFKNKPVSTGFT